MEDALRFTDCGDFAGNDLVLLREDLLPLACGGNKARIAAALVRDARGKGASHVVAYGNARSNLARAVAMLCARDGLRCTVISPSDDDGTRVDSANARIVRSVGARIVPCRKDSSVADCVRETMEGIRLTGETPYYVFGDSTGHGNERTLVSAYRAVGRALAAARAEGRLSADRVLLGVGTGSTHAGLLGGLREAGWNVPVVGLTIARPPGPYREGLAPLLAAASVGETPEVSDIGLAGGYGRTTPEELAFIARFLREKAIALDPVYAGKALWAASLYLRQARKAGERVLFVHTGSWPLVASGI